MSYNRFKNNSYNRSKPFIKPSFKMNINEYPELNNSNNNINNNSNINNSNNNNNNNFANAILKQIPNIENNETLKPGWISITNVNNKFIYNYGLNTIKKIEEQDSLDPNLIMDNIISKIVENRERYKKQYNEINGDNAFEDFYEKNSNIDIFDDENEELDLLTENDTDFIN
jgi:hypothetical protein